MIHCDVLESGWQCCDDYDPNSKCNYFLTDWFELDELIAIWHNSFNVIETNVVYNGHKTVAYITYREGGTTGL